MWAVYKKQIGKYVATERLRNMGSMDTKTESCKHLETKPLLRN
jgi:hypothetical protein